jgi:hypothetical protein
MYTMILEKIERIYHLEGLGLNTTQGILNIWTKFCNFVIFNISRDDLDLDNTFLNDCVLDECTYRWVAVIYLEAPWIWSEVTETIWENIYHLCTLLVLISNYSTVQDVEHTKLGLDIWILKFILNKRMRWMDWFDLAQDSENLPSTMNIVVDIWDL